MRVTFGQPDDDASWTDVRDLITRSFAMAPVAGQPWEAWEQYSAQVGRAQFRLLREDDAPVGALCTFRVGQWFGGSALPMGGLAAVCVGQAHRGKGAGARLVRAQLEELREEGVPLAALYASTQRLYRSVGFEQAGSWVQWAVALDAVPSLGAEIPVVPIAVDDPLLHGLHRRFGAATPGAVDRDASFWARVRQEHRAACYGFLLGSREDPHGYVLYTVSRREDGFQQLDLRDVVTLTPAGARRFWTLLHDHRAIAREARWIGPSNDPLLMLLPERRARVLHVEPWLIRLVDVPSALAGRGYAADGEIHLDVADASLPSNQGRFVLRVAGGVAEVTAGGRGALRAPITALAPLFTGYARATTLGRLGLIDGPPEALAAAERLFSGPEPWMSDRF